MIDPSSRTPNTMNAMPMYGKRRAPHRTWDIRFLKGTVQEAVMEELAR